MTRKELGRLRELAVEHVDYRGRAHVCRAEVTASYQEPLLTVDGRPIRIGGKLLWRQHFSCRCDHGLYHVALDFLGTKEPQYWGQNYERVALGRDTLPLSGSWFHLPEAS